MTSEEIRPGGVYRSVTGWLRRVERITAREGVKTAVYRDLPPGDESKSVVIWSELKEARLSAFAGTSTGEVT